MYILPIATAYSVELNIKEKQYECFYRNVSISVDKKSGVEDMKRQIIHEKCHIINVPTCQIMEVYKERWLMPLKNKFILGKAANINIIFGSESNYAGDVLRQIE